MAMLGALATGNVVALGLGEIDLKSSLNQPLSAEVELLSATDAELAELKITIGSSAAFDNAGIERPLFLTKLRFDVKTKPDGTSVIRITSRDAVQEPFLDFLLELSWSKGRVLREYTVLVDPPVTMPAAAPALQAPVAQPVTPSAHAPGSFQPARRVTHTAQMPPVSVGPGEYGPVKRNDTLWKVASQVRPDTGVSIEQTMLGLLRANPEAFQGNNINNLKAGYILRVPSREDMMSISRAEARRESRAQYAAWREARGLPQPVQAQGATQLAAPVAESRLELVSPDTAEGGVATGSTQDDAQLQKLQSELLMANEAVEEQRRQGEDMSSRLSVLEEQIINMQRLIQLKDEELARLQAQAGVESAEQPFTELETGEALAEAEEPALSTETDSVAGDEFADADPFDADAAFDETVAETAVADAEMDEVPAEGLIEDSVEEDVVAATPEVEPVVSEPVVSEPVVPDTAVPAGFIDQLLANPLWLGAGGIVLALLAFFGLRRKRGVETEFQESILQAAQEGSAAASDSELVAAEPVSTQPVTSESSLLSEFAVSDMGSIKSGGEADPLAEADVYLAYGRFQQAEDLIKDALENDAEQEDLNLKLLEIYLAGRNKSSFDEHAQGILARLENSEDPQWEKVAEMGRELSPENPIYQAGNVAAVATDEDAEIDSLSDVMDFSMDEEVAETGGIKDAEEGLDFDLDLSFDADANADQPDSVEPAPSIDSAEQPEPSAPESKVAMDSVEPDAMELDTALDFDLEGFELGSEAETEAELEGDGELTDLDEVSTKLDLARAYIDMGDPDGAKSILDEVMDEGNDDQKDEARGIMAQMS
ncbi:MAG: FimV/HubP family polar landmark protein [Pseudomonadota bacterium]|nr:FimV/HubP family polar landmark protein [Pseudomonadota bacterium]